MHKKTRYQAVAQAKQAQILQLSCKRLLLANSLPLSQIQISWHSTNLDRCLEETKQATFHKELELLLAMEMNGLIAKWQIAQILFETSKLGRQRPIRMSRNSRTTQSKGIDQALFFIRRETMYNKNQDQALQSMTDINAYTTAKISALDIKIARYLMFKVREEGRRQARLCGTPLRITAHELLGKSAFERIFGEERMPSLKEIIRIADKLNMFVEIRACRPGNTVINHKLFAERKLCRKEFRKFIECLNLASEQQRCDAIVKNYREKKLKLLRRNGSKLCWSTLIGYSIAAGFDLDVWLTPKDLRSNFDKATPRRNYTA